MRIDCNTTIDELIELSNRLGGWEAVLLLIYIQDRNPPFKISDIADDLRLRRARARKAVALLNESGALTKRGKFYYKVKS